MKFAMLLVPATEVFTIVELMSELLEFHKYRIALVIFTASLNIPERVNVEERETPLLPGKRQYALGAVVSLTTTLKLRELNVALPLVVVIMIEYVPGFVVFALNQK